jgi:ribosome modulation factor
MVDEDGTAPLDPMGEGMDAHSRRLSRSDCPYPDGSAERDSWLAGWDRQQLNEGDFSAAED